jgi:periplasmic protein CpxP/Spy
MQLTTEEREQVVTELKRFSGDMNLTDQQKEKLQAALIEGREKIKDYRKDNPNATKADLIQKVEGHRDEIRKRIGTFLSPEQLTKWNSEVSKAKEFLGNRTVA